MAYSDVEWTNGDVITEVKLDQMCENTEVVRNDGAYSPILTTTVKINPDIDDVTGDVTGVNVTISVAGVSVFSSQRITSITSPMPVSADNDISAATDGINDIVVTVGDSDGEDYSLTFKFVKTGVMNFVTAWLDLDSFSPSQGNDNSTVAITIISHYAAETWT